MHAPQTGHGSVEADDGISFKSAGRAAHERRAGQSINRELATVHLAASKSALALASWAAESSGLGVASPSASRRTHLMPPSSEAR
jgi:hypothetical protein